MKKHLLLILLIACFISVTAQDKPKYRLGLTYSSSLRSNKETFEFLVNGTYPLTLKSTTPVVYIPVLLDSGQHYSIVQTSGPRPVNFMGGNNGVMQEPDQLVSVSCGTPPLTIFKFQVIGIEPGETFSFSDNFGRGPATFRFSTTINFGGYPRGDDYVFTQNSGPRQAVFTLGSGVVPDSPIVVIADCRRNPGTPDTPSTGKYKFGVAYSSSIQSNKETFEFLVNNTYHLSLQSATPVVYLPVLLDSGQRYTISQLSGPRTVNFLDAPTGIMPAADMVMMADCGYPPLTLFKLKITGIEPGETFSFADNYRRTLTTSFSTTVNMGGFPRGDDYQIVQTSGPRQARMSLNTGIVPDSPIVIIADCRKPLEPFTPPQEKYDLLTRSSDNSITSSYYESWAPVVGGKGADEGRYVAFTMYGKGIDGSSGNYRQVYWRDRKTGITKMVSKTAEGVEGNSNSFVPAISADGQTVAFESFASNLCESDNNGLQDVFVWNAETGKLSLVSKAEGGGTGKGASTEPVLSGDGSVVAYTSGAPDIVTLEPVYSTPNVLVYDQHSGSTVCITRDYETGKAASGYSPTISEDGTRIAFCSYSNRLVEKDENGLWDIFLWQSGTPGLRKISVSSAGAERKQGNESASRVIWPSISGDGNFIVYATTADGLVPEDLNGFQDIYLYNISSRQVKRVSIPENAAEGDGDSPVSQGERIGISYDGRWITYNTAATNMGVPKGNIIMQDTRTGRIVPITMISGGSTARPMISRYGRFVVAGCSEKYDPRFVSSGLFSFYTGEAECVDCNY